MYNFRFLVSWISSSLLMFCASYIWHGIYLTDFSRLSYPLNVFLTIASIVYLLFGFIVTKGYDFRGFPYFQKKPLIRGTLTGMMCGLLIFLTTLVVGVSFSNALTVESLMFDITWQIIEQGLGGFAVGVVYYFMAGAPAYSDLD